MTIGNFSLMSYNCIFMMCLDWTSYSYQNILAVWFLIIGILLTIFVLFVCHRALFLSHFILLYLKRFIPLSNLIIHPTTT